MISLGTQTDLNFELILNFISNDLPRLVSYDLVPMLLKIMTDPCKDSGGDLNKSLRMKVEELIRSIVEKSLPKSQTIEINRSGVKYGSAPAQKRRKTDFITTTTAPQEEKVSSVTLIHKPECGVCGQVFEKYPDVVKHLHTHKETLKTAINCNLCNFSSIQPRSLAVHMKEKHLLGKGAPVSIRCKICQEEFYSESALKKHKKSYHRGSDIPKCPRCNVLFEFSSQLVTHLKFSATCGGNSTRQAVDSEASRYLKLPPAPAAMPAVTLNSTLDTPCNQINLPAPVNGVAPVSAHTDSAGAVPPTNAAQAVHCVTLSGQGTNTANMVGNALLSALTLDPVPGGNPALDTALLAVPQTTIPPVMPQNISENLIMDPTTGKPIPVSQFVNKRQAENAIGVEVMNAVVHTSKGFKCSVCNRSFTSLSMLVHHNEKAHLRKKTLSCTQCHLLFATFPELDSHFHRIHRRKISSSVNSDNTLKSKTEQKTGGQTDVKSGGKSGAENSTESVLRVENNKKGRPAQPGRKRKQTKKPSELDHVEEKKIGEEKIRDEEEDIEIVQTKSKRGRTIAKVNYTEITK